MTHEREITEPVDLCRPDGRLNPDAVGWSRRPLHRANLRGWGRAKRWEHWGVVTPTHILGLVASSLDYAGVQSLYLLDRRTGRETTAEAVVPFARGTVLPPVSGAGPVRARGGKLTVAVDQGPDGSTVRASAPGVEVDLTVPLPPGHESLGVVVPWSTRRFQYTVKDIGRPVHGTLTVDGTAYPVSIVGLILCFQIAASPDICVSSGRTIPSKGAASMPNHSAIRPHIQSPPDGAIYAIDPDIPHDRQRVVVTAHGAPRGSRLVLDDGRQSRADRPLLWLPDPGRRQIALVAADG